MTKQKNMNNNPLFDKVYFSFLNYPELDDKLQIVLPLCYSLPFINVIKWMIKELEPILKLSFGDLAIIPYSKDFNLSLNNEIPKDVRSLKKKHIRKTSKNILHKYGAIFWIIPRKVLNLSSLLNKKVALSPKKLKKYTRLSQRILTKGDSMVKKGSLAEAYDICILALRYAVIIENYKLVDDILNVLYAMNRIHDYDGRWALRQVRVRDKEYRDRLQILRERKRRKGKKRRLEQQRRREKRTS